MGSVMQQKAELASFFGNALHESDEFKAGREYLMCADHKIVANEVYCRPCDVSSFDWDNMTCPDGASLASQGRPFNGYCQSNLLPPEGCSCDDVYERNEKGPMAGYVKANEVYFGRGAIQLSWNYNYIRASIALTGAPQTLCQRPDLVAKNEEYSWGAGLFYWMENVKNDKTCHQSVLIDEDFGLTLDNINGGLECPADDHGWHGKAVQLRLNRYCRAATAIGVEKLLSLEGCIDMSRRMKQCLKEGTCKACKVWEDSLNLDGGGMLASDIDDEDVQSYIDSTAEGGSISKICSNYVKEKKCVRDTSCVWQSNKEVCSDKAAKQEQKPQQQQEQQQQSSGLTQEEKDKIKQEKLEAKQLTKEQAKAEAIEAAAIEAKQETPPPRTSKPTSLPTPSPSSTPTKRVVVNPTSSAASSFGIVPLSPTKPDIKPAIPSDEEKLSSHASSFAIPHSKGQSIVPQLDTSSAFETTESLLENPGDMTNWAMTPLDDPPEPAVHGIDITTTSSQPTRKPATVNNIAEQAFRPSLSETQELDISNALPPKQESSASISMFTPLDDVTLSRSLPTLNLGSSQVIAVDMLEGEVALLRFDLSVIGDNTIHKAILRLIARDNDDEGIDHSGSYYIQSMANDWDENAVTYETAPKTTGVLFESKASQKNGNQYELDVTDAMSNHIVSFRILGTNRVRTEFISKDSIMTDNAPVLLVELESSTEQAAVVSSEISSGSGVISGHIWHDKNADGIREASEPGLRGILVDLYKCDHDKWVEGTRTTSTGDYIFNELADGSYYVDVTISSDYGFTLENAGSDKTKSSHVDSSTGRSECVELTAKSEFAIVNAGIASKSVIEAVDSEVTTTTSEEEDEDSGDYNCRGSPCAEEGFCRSQHNYCGQGEEYCNEQSRWTPDCGTRSPNDKPSVAPITDTPTVLYNLEEHCGGDPCQEEGECRSFVGYCGHGTLYCNTDSIWVPECHKPLTSIKAPTRSPLFEGMTSSPTESGPTTVMPSPSKDNSNLSPFILPTLTEIDTPKQSDIISMSSTNDNSGDESNSVDIPESSDESSRDQDEDISTTFNDVESSPWYIRYSDPRNGGCTCCLERGVLILLFTTMFILQLI